MWTANNGPLREKQSYIYIFLYLPECSVSKILAILSDSFNSSINVNCPVIGRIQFYVSRFTDSVIQGTTTPILGQAGRAVTQVVELKQPSFHTA